MLKKLIFILCLCLFLISCNNKPIIIDNDIEPKLDQISFNKEYYYCDDEITYIVPDEDDYSLYYSEIDNEDGIKKISDTLFKALDIGTYYITIKNYDYPDWSYTKKINVYQNVFTMSASTYVLPINKELTIKINSFDNLYEQSIDDFVFTSSDDSICSNKDNIFTTIKPGIFLVHAVSKYNSNVKSQLEIKVSDGTDFYVSPIKDEIKIAEEMEINVSIGKPSDYVWSSSDNEIIKIVKYDTKLKIAGVNEGETNISGYFISDPSIRTTYKITVKGVMEVDYISRFIHTALDEVGTVEVGDNHQKYGVWYGNDGQPWCATFVSWCWYHAGLSNELLLKYQGCYTGYEWCLQKGIFHYKENYTPVTGDIIFFLSNGASHTGIVIYCDGTYVYTIEGNASNKVGIWRMGVNFNQITGYAHPNYPKYDNPETFEWITGIDPNTKKYYWTHKSADDSTR